MPVARTLTVALCLAAVLAAASARAAEDLQRWVERALAPAAADYHGTVVLQIGDKMQTLRVTHLLADGKPLEWVEVLEGAPRETIRIGDEVRCFLPEDRVVLIDRAAGAAGLSYHPVGSVGRIESSYRLESLGMDRVAGREVLGVRFVPRDALRFGQDWWIDRESAVVLKRVVWEETPARALETQTFSDFHLGAATQTAVVRQKFSSRSEWRRVDLRGKSVGASETGWEFGVLPSGFQLEGILQRRGPSGKTVTQWLIGDGLVTVSVFFEPWEGTETSEQVERFGATTVVRRQDPGALRTAMGEVPSATLQALLAAMTRKGGA